MDIIPFVLQEHCTQVRSEIQGKDVSLIFGGTTRLGSTGGDFALYWWVDCEATPCKCQQKSVTGEELARIIISVLSVSLGVESGRLIAVMQGGVSVNSAALRTIAVVYLALLDMCCISHTLDLIEDKLRVPTVSLFFTLWVSLFAHSPKVRAQWKERTGRAMATYSQTW